MSFEFGLQPPPPSPPAAAAYVSDGGRGSIGPVIAVLVVIAVLGVLAVIVGRLCSGRMVMGYGHYDLEGWIERKFGSCLDGRLEEPPPRASPAAAEEGTVETVNGTVPAAAPSAVEAKPPGCSAAAAE